MPRLLLWVAVAVIVLIWLKRVSRTRARPGRTARSAPDADMPKNLICGGCGKQYDPQQHGWICPQCHK